MVWGLAYRHPTPVTRQPLGRGASHGTKIDDELEVQRCCDAAERVEARSNTAGLQPRDGRLRAPDARGQLRLGHAHTFARLPHALGKLEGLLGTPVFAPSSRVSSRVLDRAPTTSVSRQRRPPLCAHP